MTRGNTGHLHPINPEIDRTYHRLVRQSRNLPFHSVHDSVSDSDSISNFIPVSVHSVQYTDFVHSVALSDSEHSENSVYSENMAQPPTPPGPPVKWNNKKVKDKIALPRIPNLIDAQNNFHMGSKSINIKGITFSKPVHMPTRSKSLEISKKMPQNVVAWSNVSLPCAPHKDQGVNSCPGVKRPPAHALIPAQPATDIELANSSPPRGRLPADFSLSTTPLSLSTAQKSHSSTQRMPPHNSYPRKSYCKEFKFHPTPLQLDPVSSNKPVSPRPTELGLNLEDKVGLHGESIDMPNGPTRSKRTIITPKWMTEYVIN
ncbi:hypothetical protein Lal_00008497 [Lupinus albus]|nr:hypothetical protein Lal_00008497 [Lupinus albus]